MCGDDPFQANQANQGLPVTPAEAQSLPCHLAARWQWTPLDPTRATRSRGPPKSLWWSFAALTRR